MISQMDISILKADGSWPVFHKLLLLKAAFYVVSCCLTVVLEILNITTKQFHHNCSILYHLTLLSYALICLGQIVDISFEISGWGAYVYLEYYISWSSLFFGFIVLLFIPTVTFERYYATKYVNCYEEKSRNVIPVVLVAVQTGTAITLTGLVKTIDHFAINTYFITPIYGLVALFNIGSLIFNNRQLLKRNLYYRDCEVKPYYLSREYQIKENLTWCKMTKTSSILLFSSIGLLIVITPFVYGILTLVYLDKWWNKLTKFYENQVEQCTPANCKVGPANMSVMSDPQSTTHSQQQGTVNQADAYFEAVSRQWA